jgi:protoheme IX farnesyltransferase
MASEASQAKQGSIFKQYYKLTKPGIIYGNVTTTIAAFLFAWRWHGFSVGVVELFLATVVGIGLVIGSACVFNNWLDIEIDKKMARTQNRPLVTGAISVRSALIYGTILGLLGIALLYFKVNPLTAALGVIGFIFYVWVYGVAKRGSHWGAIVGSISGAVPIVVGYTAVVNHLDGAALILFLILVAWQMPHFYAIAIYRFDEYAAAGIPTLPAQKGIHTSKVHILLYIVAYLVAASALTVFGYAGYVYLALVLIFGARWLLLGIKGFRTAAPDDAKWARKVFLFSLVIILTFSITLAVAPLLP